MANPSEYYTIHFPGKEVIVDMAEVAVLDDIDPQIVLRGNWPIYLGNFPELYTEFKQAFAEYRERHKLN